METTSAKIYVDGVLVLSDTTSAFSSGFGLGPNFYVGGADTQGAGGATRNGMDGMIDEVALYELDGTLADDQVRVASIASHYSLVPEPSSTILFGLFTSLGLLLRRKRI